MTIIESLRNLISRLFSVNYARRATDVAGAQSGEPIDVKAAMGEALIADLIQERRSERRWRHVKRLFISGGTLAVFAVYVGFYVTSLGYRLVPNTEIVGIVRITGAIAENSKTASAEAVIPALAKAFDKPNVKAVVLAIDSGGGRPGEAERIYNYIDARKRETGKPVVAVIGNTGASAAYMIAVHADKIYAGKYSLVGSIGAILQSWDFHKVAERFDVAHKTYASGKLKGMLDEWSESTPEAEAKVTSMVNQLGSTFAKEVRSRRGGQLKPDFDYWTGEVWPGEEAHAIGLVDGIDTIDTVIKTTWDLKAYDFGPTKGGGGFDLPFASIAGEIADAVVTTLRDRAKF